jgi:hypothetical protein
LLDRMSIESSASRAWSTGSLADAVATRHGSTITDVFGWTSIDSTIGSSRSDDPGWTKFHTEIVGVVVDSSDREAVELPG